MNRRRPMTHLATMAAACAVLCGLSWSCSGNVPVEDGDNFSATSFDGLWAWYNRDGEHELNVQIENGEIVSLSLPNARAVNSTVQNCDLSKTEGLIALTFQEPEGELTKITTFRFDLPDSTGQAQRSAVVSGVLPGQRYVDYIDELENPYPGMEEFGELRRCK